MNEQIIMNAQKFRILLSGYPWMPNQSSNHIHETII